MIKAQWKKLVMANYVIDSGLLDQYLPVNTQYDHWNGQCYISLVGFMFRDTQILGMKIPFHTHFEEVNLRFYVKRPYNEGWKRGVVFIKEIVPLPAVTFIANTVYKEHYETMPMKHSWKLSIDQLVVEYQWRKKQWNTLKVISQPTPYSLVEKSAEEFLTEQYWGYTRVNPQLTLEYEVAHPPWSFYKTLDYEIHVDFSSVYGEEFSFLTKQKPDSVFLAEGSKITLRKGKELKGIEPNAQSN
jgi:hypothetical protein